MLIMGSVRSVLIVGFHIGLLIFCLFFVIGAFDMALKASPAQQKRALQREGRGDGLSSVWTVLAFRVLFILIGLALLAPIVLAVLGVIPWDWSTLN
jgi:hypothetical protein